MALQIGQGYLPSNVRVTDSESECVRRLSASIVVHATVCSTAQCAPSVADERNDHKNFAEPDKHNYKLNQECRIASAVFVKIVKLLNRCIGYLIQTSRRFNDLTVQRLSIQTSVPTGSLSKSGIKSAAAR